MSIGCGDTSSPGHARRSSGRDIPHVIAQRRNAHNPAIAVTASPPYTQVCAGMISTLSSSAVDAHDRAVARSEKESAGDERVDRDRTRLRIQSPETLRLRVCQP
jgi:hypothetical protein